MINYQEQADKSHRVKKSKLLLALTLPQSRLVVAHRDHFQLVKLASYLAETRVARNKYPVIVF